MSDQSQFIKEAFYLIKNSFDVFNKDKDLNISLKICSVDDFTKEDYDIAFMYYKFDEKSGMEQIEISIINDINTLEQESFNDLIQTNKTFLESNKIPIREQALLLGLLLHEFGHIYHHKHWCKMRFSWDDYVDFKNLNFSYATTVIRHNSHIIDETDENQFFRKYIFTEVFAEQFKFEHFMRFWKLLGKTTLDEFRSIQSIASLICHFNIDSNMFDNEGREYLNTIGIADEDIRLIYKLNTTVGRDLKPLIEFI